MYYLKEAIVDSTLGSPNLTAAVRVGWCISCFFIDVIRNMRESNSRMKEFNLHISIIITVHFEGKSGQEFKAGMQRPGKNAA